LNGFFWSLQSEVYLGLPNDWFVFLLHFNFLFTWFCFSVLHSISRLSLIFRLQFMFCRKINVQGNLKYGYIMTKKLMNQREMLLWHMRIHMLPWLLLSGLTTKIFMAIQLEFIYQSQKTRMTNILHLKRGRALWSSN